jgi:hypothetical protein
MEQKSFLRLYGYRVGGTCRKTDGYAVEYPRVRPGAFCHRYSAEVFTNPEAGWTHAWDVAISEPGFDEKWQRYRKLAELAASCVRTVSLPCAYDQPAFA